MSDQKKPDENVQTPPAPPEPTPKPSEPTPKPSEPTPKPSEPTKVRARLSEDSPVGALVVSGVRLERDIIGLISAEDFKRLKKEYKLEEVKQ